VRETKPICRTCGPGAEDIPSKTKPISGAALPPGRQSAIQNKANLRDLRAGSQGHFVQNKANSREEGRRRQAGDS